MGTTNVRVAVITGWRLWRDEPIKLLQNFPHRESHALCPFPLQIWGQILFPKAFLPTSTRKKRCQSRTANSPRESRAMGFQRTRTNRPQRGRLIWHRLKRDIPSNAIFWPKKVKWSPSLKILLSISNLPRGRRKRCLRHLPKIIKMSTSCSLFYLGLALIFHF